MRQTSQEKTRQEMICQVLSEGVYELVVDLKAKRIDLRQSLVIYTIFIVFNMSEKPALRCIPIQPTTTYLVLKISCEQLTQPDTDSIPQVFVILLDVSRKNGDNELGRTESISNDLNPRFVNNIVVRYHFGTIQRLRLEVNHISSLGINELLGRIETTLATILGSSTRLFKQPLVDGLAAGRGGCLIVEVEESTACKRVASFNLSANHLPRSFFGLLAPSPRVYIHCSDKRGRYNVAHRSSAIPRNRSPNFGEFNVTLSNLCYGYLDRPIKFELIDKLLDLPWCLGFFETTINQLNMNKKNKHVFHLLQPKAKILTQSRPKTSGMVTITSFKLTDQNTFVGYITTGVQLHLMVAVDFNRSNGKPKNFYSLHHLDLKGRRLNQYEEVLMAVADIIKPYNGDNIYAGFGFGAKTYESHPATSQSFALNGNQQNPYVSSIENLLQVYRSSVRNVKFSEPSNFTCCIERCVSIAKDFDGTKHYFVLLIVTNDSWNMDQFKTAILEASRQPISIIICGVGPTDFGAMEVLEDYNSNKTVDRRSAHRDIVQFVPMNRFLDPKNSRASKASMLAGQMLKNVPDQMTAYMSSRSQNSDL